MNSFRVKEPKFYTKSFSIRVHSCNSCLKNDVGRADVCTGATATCPNYEGAKVFDRVPPAKPMATHGRPGLVVHFNHVLPMRTAIF